MVSQLWQYLRYWCNEVHFSSAITFDKLQLTKHVFTRSITSVSICLEIWWSSCLILDHAICKTLIGEGTRKGCSDTEQSRRVWERYYDAITPDKRVLFLIQKVEHPSWHVLLVLVPILCLRLRWLEVNVYVARQWAEIARSRPSFGLINKLMSYIGKAPGHALLVCHDAQPESSIFRLKLLQI